MSSKPSFDTLHEILKEALFDPIFDHTVLTIANIMKHVRRMLFPHSHILRQDIRDAIESMAEDIILVFESFRTHLLSRAEAIHNAKNFLPSLARARGVELLAGYKRWMQVLPSLHMPTGSERRVFRHLASFYDAMVYMPFLEAHRQSPSHNMWELNSHLTAIYLALEDLWFLCAGIDDLVRPLYKEMKAAEAALRNVPLQVKVDIYHQQYWMACSNLLSGRAAAAKELQRLEETPLRARNIFQVTRILHLQSQLGVPDGEDTALLEVDVKDFAAADCRPSLQLPRRRHALSVKECVYKLREFQGREVRVRRPWRSRQHTIDSGVDMEAYLRGSKASPKTPDREGRKSPVRRREHTL
ncbi:hypothetical protein BJ546DRAFT_1064679 [Cryomyces antarcticus]